MENGNKYRLKMLEAAVKSGRGHLGGAFSCIEILMAIHEVMDRHDDFILSKGHAGVALYSLLFNDLNGFCEDGSKLTEHPSVLIPKIRLTTGSLGHGIGLGCGMALAKKLKNEEGRIYVLVGDGECMEGSVYEAAMFAAQYRLDNLCVIVDNNGVMSTRNLPSVDYRKIFESLGWTVDPTDGHDLNELRASLKIRYLGTKPHAIVAQTVKGKGVSFMEGKHEWHNGVPKGEQLEIARKELQCQN